LIELTKIFTFDSAHRLPFHDGMCKELHGHTYTLEVTLRGEPNDNGILIDFGDLKRIVNSWILKKLDHKYLNDVLKDDPTAENIAKYIFIILRKCSSIFKDKLYSITVWETRTSKATYYGDDK